MPIRILYYAAILFMRPLHTLQDIITCAGFFEYGHLIHLFLGFILHAISGWMIGKTDRSIDHSYSYIIPNAPGIF
jgi:hypothetical protein